MKATLYSIFTADQKVRALGKKKKKKKLRLTDRRSTPVSLITAKEQSTAKYRKELFDKMCQNKYGHISAITGLTVKYDIPICFYISRETHFFDYILDQINRFQYN